MRVTICVNPADAKSWDDICHDIAIGIVNRVEIRGTRFDKVVQCSECIHHKSTDVYDYCNLIRLPINLDDFCSRGSTSADTIPEPLSIDVGVNEGYERKKSKPKPTKCRECKYFDEYNFECMKNHITKPADVWPDTQACNNAEAKSSMA